MSAGWWIAEEKSGDQQNQYDSSSQCHNYLHKTSWQCLQPCDSPTLPSTEPYSRVKAPGPHVTPWDPNVNCPHDTACVSNARNIMCNLQRLLCRVWRWILGIFKTNSSFSVFSVWLSHVSHQKLNVNKKLLIILSHFFLTQCVSCVGVYPA